MAQEIKPTDTADDDAVIRLTVGQLRREIQRAAGTIADPLLDRVTAQRDRLVAACQRLLGCHDHGQIGDVRAAMMQVQEAVREATNRATDAPRADGE